mmetsp:Transcript_2002/g.7294  ORF Transcript_2002/g.7294 Transcript_2002/m.7294 type:complete len:339 (+) Transcript_2002:440-1456(+)
MLRGTGAARRRHAPLAGRVCVDRRRSVGGASGPRRSGRMGVRAAVRSRRPVRAAHASGARRRAHDAGGPPKEALLPAARRPDAVRARDADQERDDARARVGLRSQLGLAPDRDALGMVLDDCRPSRPVRARDRGHGARDLTRERHGPRIQRGPHMFGDGGAASGQGGGDALVLHRQGGLAGGAPSALRDEGAAARRGRRLDRGRRRLRRNAGQPALQPRRAARRRRRRARRLGPRRRGVPALDGPHPARHDPKGRRPLQLPADARGGARRGVPGAPRRHRPPQQKTPRRHGGVRHRSRGDHRRRDRGPPRIGAGAHLAARLRAPLAFCAARPARLARP